MKSILFLLLIIPTSIFAKYKWPDPCDSLSKTISLPSLTRVELMRNSMRLLQAMKFINNLERITGTQINDSTIVCKGTFQLRKTGKIRKDIVYGKYKVSASCDGFIDFIMTITVNDGFLSYDVKSAKQYGSRITLDEICQDDRNYIIYVNGVKISFLRHIEKIINDLTVMY